MKRIHNTIKYIAVMAMLIVAPSLFADSGATPIKVTNHTSTKGSDNKLNTTFDIVIDNSFELKSNDMIIFTPVLKSNTTNDSIVLEPMVLIGKTRNKAELRKEKLKNPSVLPSNTFAMVQRIKNKEQTIHYQNVVEYSSWMRNAKINISNVVMGCASCQSDEVYYAVSDRILPDVSYNPTYKLSLIVPEVERVKERCDKYSASFNYVVAKSDLIRSYKNNEEKLEEVDNIIHRVQSDKNLEITDFSIVGYASPEGNYHMNKALAESRASSFASYLSTRTHINKSKLYVSAIGEDWVQLRKMIEASTINDKSAILNIIDNIKDPDQRDVPLKKLSNGATYNTLLNEYYPALRRTEYSIAYVARPFDAEEAKTVMKTNPKHLSLNEMYLVAETYPTGSKEFKEVFEIALKHFPDSEIALVNAAVAAIEAGDNEGAIKLIESSLHKEKALNILGVAYARSGKLDVANTIFNHAADAGDLEAKHNINELNKHIKGLEE